MKKLLLSLAAFALTATASMAQVSLKSNNGDFSLRFIGRTNLDYGRFISHSDEKDYGFRMNDTRLGVQASFDQKWSAKAEICYQNSAISFRDLWIGYQINDKMSLKGGNHFQPFGAKTLGLAYKFIEDAQADYAICPSRKIGISWNYVTNPILLQAGVYSDGNVDKLTVNQGYSVAAKIIGRPICNDTTVLHFGAAGMYTDVANDYSYTVKQAETFANHSLMSFKSLEDHTSNINRGEFEVIFLHKRFYFESHYLTAFSNLDYEDNFQTNGFYAQASFLLIGQQQNYNKKTGLAQNASPKNLELLARVNYLKMDETNYLKDVVDEETNNIVYKETVSPDEKEIDFTLGLNYFFNKNLNARLNYTVSKTDINGDEHTNNAIQARMQFSF